MKNPKISIIVPVFNVEKYLRPCLNSILSQTYSNFEAVLVDDGSTDTSGTICDEYAERDNRFVVIHKKNEGVAKARIIAFEHSTGELITFIDADDHVNIQYIEKLAKPIIEENADMVSCNFYNVIDGKYKEAPARLYGTYEKEQLTDFIANHYFYDKSIRREGMTRFLCTKMVKRKYVREALERGSGLWFGEDQVATFSILYRIEKLSLIADKLYYYVRYNQQTTKKYNLSLWNSIISMLQRYSEIDQKGIAKYGIRRRTWYYINVTIFTKMMKTIHTYGEFKHHMSIVRENPYINDFFKQQSIFLNVKENLKYWLLKLRLFNIFYFFIKILPQK